MAYCLEQRKIEKLKNNQALAPIYVVFIKKSVIYVVKSWNGSIKIKTLILLHKFYMFG